MSRFSPKKATQADRTPTDHELIVNKLLSSSQVEDTLSFDHIVSDLKTQLFTHARIYVDASRVCQTNTAILENRYPEQQAIM